MQSGASREAILVRRARVTCPHCGTSIDLVRMRAHLREAHQVSSAELEATLLTARREARRATRSSRRQ
jgi:hypothetical protein